MPEKKRHACTYWVVRYTTNLLRDEWLNVGILLFDPVGSRFRARIIETSGEFGRLRRLHPTYDERFLRALGSHFEASVAGADNPAEYLAQLGQTLSNSIQLGPPHGVLAEDFEAELERLYQQHVAPPGRPTTLSPEFEIGRAYVRLRLNECFRRAGLSERVERQVRIDEFTFEGDPFRLDFAYWRDQARGFVQALSIERDTLHARALAYTVERIRARLASSEFTVVTDAQPQADNDRHRVVVRLLTDQQVGIVPVTDLEPWVDRLRSAILQ
jgi:hypothetical protein